MRKIVTIFSSAACLFGSGLLAHAGSFNPELRPLGSLGEVKGCETVNEAVTAGSLTQQRSTSNLHKNYVENSLKTKCGLIQSSGVVKSVGSPYRAEASASVNLSVPSVDGYEVYTAAVAIIDESTKGLLLELLPDEETGIIPAQSVVDLDIDHAYSVIAYGELTKENETKAVAFYGDLELVDGVLNVVVDYNECVRPLAFQAYMGNGEQFPEYQPWEYGCGYNITYGSQLSYAGYYANFKVNNPMTFYVYCNEFPGSAYYSISYSAMVFDDRIYCSLAGGGTIGSFEDPENMVELIPAAFYDNLSFTCSLSPADRAIGKATLVSGSKQDLAQLMDDGRFGLASYTVAMQFNDPTREPVDEFGFYTWIPSSTIATNVQTSMVFTGFGAYNESSAKYCGARTRVMGTVYILPWEQTWNEEKQTYSPYSSISDFNIKPGQQDIQNFVYPLYANSYVSIEANEETNKVGGASCNATYYGMFHEKMNYTGESTFKSFTIDGVEKEFNDILEVSLSETHSLDFTFHNPDGYVQNQFETEGLNVLHVTTANPADMIPPRLLGVQMRDLNGKIKTSFEADEDCSLLVSMYDRTTENTASNDFDVKLYVAEQNSEEWTEITEVDVTEYSPALGKAFEYTIPTDGTVSANKWLKLKLVGEDASGNTNTMILDYCMCIGTPDGVKNINPDGANGAAEYYNMQGIRITEPAPGELVIEKTGGKARKIIL